MFALGRRALGRACAKLVPVSVAGVFNFDGSEVPICIYVLLMRSCEYFHKILLSTHVYNATILCVNKLMFEIRVMADIKMTTKDKNLFQSTKKI